MSGSAHVDGRLLSTLRRALCREQLSPGQRRLDHCAGLDEIEPNSPRSRRGHRHRRRVGACAHRHRCPVTPARIASSNSGIDTRAGVALPSTAAASCRSTACVVGATFRPTSTSYRHRRRAAKPAEALSARAQAPASFHPFGGPTGRPDLRSPSRLDNLIHRQLAITIEAARDEAGGTGAGPGRRSTSRRSSAQVAEDDRCRPGEFDVGAGARLERRSIEHWRPRQGRSARFSVDVRLVTRQHGEHRTGHADMWAVADLARRPRAIKEHGADAVLGVDADLGRGTCYIVRA